MSELITLPIKPLSVNEAWKGRRFKTDKYKRYCKDIALLLPKKIELPAGKFGIRFHFYFSNKSSDWDNPIKTTQDAICSNYGLNDSNMYLGIVEKFICKKGDERIEFEIFAYED